MTAEMSAVYGDRSVPPGVLNVESDAVRWTGLACDATGRAVGHAALRTRGQDIELKRMFVESGCRGMGVAQALLDATHQAARDMGYTTVILQTGDRQPDAVRLYERNGYRHIPVFAPYDQIFYSICMAKDLLATLN
ncbi:GNAT family N-acetyltransferase [Williamsia sp. CHRR-6]|nr:GNAT family N-acetyltransferase [Williamsia sp. CHRR-6]